MKKRHEILFNQLAEYRSYTLAVASEVTEEEAELIPRGFNNNIRWNLGHIYLDQLLWIQQVTREKANLHPMFNSWFGFGRSPANFDENTPDIHELKDLLKDQISKIKEEYGDRLEEEFEPTEMGMHTIEQVLSRTIFHEGMHLQTLIDLRKCF